MTSGRIRIGQCEAAGSAGGSRVGGAGEGDAKAQLKWAAQFASSAAGGGGSDGRTWSKRSVVVSTRQPLSPTLSSQSLPPPLPLSLPLPSLLTHPTHARFGALACSA